MPRKLSSNKFTELESQIMLITGDKPKTVEILDSIKKICNIVEDKTYGDYHRKYYEEHKKKLNAKRAENIRKQKEIKTI